MPAALIVEDDAAVARLLSLVLASEGIGSTTTPCVVAALDMLLTQPVALVLVDLALARRSGVELLESLAAMPTSPRCVIVSAACDAGEVARRFGMPLIRKPFHIASLVAEVRRSVGVG